MALEIDERIEQNDEELHKNENQRDDNIKVQNLVVFDPKPELVNGELARNS